MGIRSFPRAGRTGALVALAATLAMAAGAQSAFAGAGSNGTGARLGPPNGTALQQAITGLPTSTIVGSLVEVGGTDGFWQGVSGLGDVATGTAPSVRDRYRIGSVTKVFTAIVTLQLVAEHRVSLDQPVQGYLPGVVPADYAPITVAELLNHTSGLPRGGGPGDDEGDPAGFVAHRFEHPTPEQILAALQGTQPTFAPGTEQQYNGMNYFLLGALIEKITGHSYASEVDARILRPLHLTDTQVPAATDYRIPGPHLHGYQAVSADDGTGSTQLVDVTEQSPYPWAEGGMISSARDLSTLMTALFRGRLMPSAELNAMLTVPDVPYLGTDQCQVGTPGRACFGLGVMRATLDGVTVWGKTGSRPGYTDGVFATRDLQRVLVYAFTPTSEDANTIPFILGIATAALT